MIITVNFSIVVEHCSFPAVQGSSKRIHLWKQGDYAAMSHYLTNCDWSHMISTHLTPDDLWRAFCDVFYEAIDMFVPSVETRSSNASQKTKKYPSNIRVLCARKRCLWKQMRCNPSNDILSAKYRQLVYEYRTAVSDFECKRESELINSRNVNRRLHNSNSSSVLMDSGVSVFTDQGKAEVFNSYLFSKCG